MDQSLTESDLSMSPTQILERLQMLRQHQLLQRVKLQKQRLEYQESPENSSVITEFVSHFTNSTSYNTFRSLLQSYDETSKCSPRPKDLMMSNIGNKLEEKDLVDGVSVLNLSQESDCIVTPPLSSGSRVSGSSNSVSINVSSPQNSNNNSARNSANKKHIELDEIPILTPKKDFEAMIIEKLQIEMQKKIPKPVISNSNKQTSEKSKKSFLRRGEGMARFGLTKNDVIIQNTTALPWKRKSVDTKANNTKKINSKVHGKRLPKSGNPIKPLKHNEYKVNVEILVPPEQSLKLKRTVPVSDSTSELKTPAVVDTKDMENTTETVDTSHCYIHAVKTPVQERPQGVHPLKANKGKTWAAILTKEQDDFLRQLKQSDYYKNFASPAKSVLSDISCDENLTILRQEREVADQKMFDLLENKVAHESFSIENSFFNRFLKKKQLECSGESTRESTPMILQKCLARNPNLMHIFPGSQSKKTHEEIHSNVETCDSDYTDCDHESFSTESGCSSCETAEKNQSLCMQKETVSKDTGHKDRTTKTRTEKDKPSGKDKCQDNIVTENATMKADMAEMNEKLAATSELLKDRLKELEDEIETFRKENSNLAKMREEVDLERQKFYEEKATFEQKYNEEKILSEYYLAEEKDRLAKQKQVYERYVREMRGRLNKKEKDEVINLKNEISDLKDEIRVKDAKSTSCIARLRNQLKIMEKEKTNIQGEVEKLKKENRRLHHSNEITRRMTNIKYLQEINKKLTSMTSKESQSEVKTDGDIKYKAFEIERQSRSRKREPTTNKTIMPRAKSVPNLNVTSRYAKYFSQRDAHSQMDEDKTINTEHKSPYSCESDEYEETIKYDVNEFLNLDDSASISDKEDRENEVQNNLEKLYTERFKCTSPHSSTSSLSKSNSRHSLSDKPDNQTADNVNTNCFFLRKSNFSADSDRNSKSPNERHTSPYLHTSTESNSSKSPVSVLTHRSNRDQQSTEHLTNHSSSNSRLKSPISILSNHSSGSQRSSNEYHHSDIRTLDPSCSKTSLTKTSLNPTEIKKPDGSRELRFPNGNVKHISADGKYSKFIYYNGDVKENFYNEGRIKYFYAETKTYHVTHGDGLEVLEFPDGQIEKRYRDGSSEIRLPNGSVRYQDPKNRHVREEWRFPDGTTMTVSATGEERVVFSNGQVEVHAKDHKRREFPNGTVKMVYNDGTSETRFSSGRVRIKDKHGNLIMDSASR